ncbi:MAG TPA: hypothetical protein VNZ49_04235 [Bacteroidia bacterium]|jgi:hypothetical protein|nr:hypothetical protein [Bacteroidia bacterium]
MKNINYFLLTALFFLCIKATAQGPDRNKKYYSAAVGFWNVENFYDTLNDPLKSDEEFLPAGPNLWDTKKYKTKIDHVSDVISQLATDATPDGVAIMGLCEIENINVLKDIVKAPKLAPRNYKIVHVEGPDARGVDVAFLYNPKYFKVTSFHSYHLTLVTDSTHTTRDQLLVSGKLLGEDFHFIVCHWPSRSFGEMASQPNRIAAAKLGRKIIDSILKAEPNAKIILMGDLNDDPKDVSVRTYLNTTGKEKDAKAPLLFNAMEGHFKKGIGTLAYNDAWNLFDQQIMTPALVKGDYKDLQFYVSRIFNNPMVLETEGKYKGYPKRTFSGGAYTAGYSDHFSVFSVFLKEIPGKK